MTDSAGPASPAWPDVPAWSQRVFGARNANEAILFVRCQGGGADLESRAVGQEIHYLASHPEGRRVHRFTLGGGAPWDPADVGEGCSGILDPAELVFFADAVVRDLPRPGDRVIVRAVVRELRLAAAALREAVKLVDRGGVGYFTNAAKQYVESHPDRFTVAALNRYAAVLESQADWWQGAGASPMDLVDVLRGFRAQQIPRESFLRAVIGHPAWRIPVDDVEHPMLWTLDGRNFVAAQSIPVSPDGALTRWMEVDGRHLARNLPSDCAGVVFDLGTPHACVVDFDESPDPLAHWADVLDVEKALRNPAPGQTATLVDHRWWLLDDAGGHPFVEDEDGLLVVHLFTAADRLAAFLGSRPAYRQARPAEAPGRDLFAALADRSDYDAIAVHYGVPGVEALGPELLGPQAASLFAAGMDGRTTARVLQARTVAEIHLFLDLEGVSRDGRTHQLEYLGDRLVARYGGTVAGSPRTWWFDPVEVTDDPLDLGVGPSRILCAGLLADLVRRRMRLLSGSPADLDAEDLREAAGAARWAREVEKMLSDGALPRSAIRSPDGSRYLREFPEMADGAWVVAARQRAESLTG